jgi:sulfite reductase (NADPH) flavoprotein alpha-component|tara:strand:- start:114 stop:566 length:453 start_codon:yes stop_codon:yes gene_type:complete
MNKEMIIAYGTETGNSELLAMDTAKIAEGLGYETNIGNLDDYTHQDLCKATRLIVICSTWGDGEQPDNAEESYDATCELDTGDLTGVRFAVLALGDTAFDLFCEAGKQWDEVLESKGALRINERLDCDTDYDDYAEEWIEETLDKFVNAD